MKVELKKKLKLWVGVDALGDQPSWVAGLGHDGQGLQVEGLGSLLPCCDKNHWSEATSLIQSYTWRIDPSTVLPSRFSWRSRNL